MNILCQFLSIAYYVHINLLQQDSSTQKTPKIKIYLVVKVEALRDPGGLDGDGGGLGDGVPVLGEGAHGAVTQHHPGVVTEGAHRDTLRSGVNILP